MATRKSSDPVATIKKEISALERKVETARKSLVADAEKAGKKLNNALTSLNKAEDQLAKAEVKEYRDQVQRFREAVDEVSKNKDLTLAEAAEQLKGKAAPVVAAREQLAATTVCVAVEDDTQKDGTEKDGNGKDDTQKDPS